MTNYLVRPEGDGLRAVLFDLEADIMEVIWSADDEICVHDVLDVLQQSREIAYTTVMTTVSRLFEKGLLDRRKEGRRYIYAPQMTRHEFLAELARDIYQRLPDAGKDAAAAFLVDRVSESDHDELDRLEELIRRRREEIS
jgi:predicted transcriptional regulator